MSVVEVGEFLSYLANERKVASATQNQALNALNFLYKRVLNKAGRGVRSRLIHVNDSFFAILMTQ